MDRPIVMTSLGEVGRAEVGHLKSLALEWIVLLVLLTLPICEELSKRERRALRSSKRVCLREVFEKGRAVIQVGQNVKKQLLALRCAVCRGGATGGVNRPLR